MRVDAYLDSLIDEHRQEPRGSIIDDLLAARVEGEPIEPRHVRGMVLLLLMAGIDTTWSAIGSGLWHFATHPDDLARMRREPELWPMGRRVVEDVEVGGRTLKKGEWVLLPFPAANRDPQAFPDADNVVLDREVNRHAAFGLGIHRCIGSNLARLELQVALQEFIARMPEFHLADPERVRWSTGQIRGPRVLPLTIGSV